MLKRLRLSNFKAWRSADLRFGKITGFFGTNSAGKSSLLQFLLLLKQTRNATDRALVLDFGDDAGLVNLGTFADVIHRHDTGRSMRWCLDWTLPNKTELFNLIDGQRWRSLTGEELKTEFEVGYDARVLLPNKLLYRFGGVTFLLQRQIDTGVFTLKTDSVGFTLTRSKSTQTLDHGPIKTHLFPREVANYRNADVLHYFERMYEDMMDSLYYLGPLREYPQRWYQWGEATPDDVGQRGERTVNAILAATRSGEMRLMPRKPDENGKLVRHEIPFQHMLSEWLKRLGLIDEFGIKEIAGGTNLYQAVIKTPGSTVSTALTDIGFGVSQVLPALVLLHYVPEGSTVLMEQPEIHLHPAVQSDLADVMLQVAEDRRVQIVVESHSEHLLRRLQRRVAEGAVSSDDVKLYFVSSNEDGATHADLKVNEYGEIENWPPNFFGDEMGEIAAIAEAALKRRMEQSR